MRVRIFEHGLDLMTPTEGYERTPGLHISEVYGDLYKKLDPKRYDKRDADGVPLPLPEDRVGFGTRFEEALEPQLAAKWKGARPGEFAVQHESDCPNGIARRKRLAPVRPGDSLCPCGAGIIYSPDYIFYVDSEDILGEFKLTWYSSKGFPNDPKFDKWKTQIKFYLRNLRMTKVWVFPFWVNGGTDHAYREVQPEFKRAYELVFTPKETEAEHRMLIRHARKIGVLPS